jgi:hypothetical protein
VELPLAPPPQDWASDHHQQGHDRQCIEHPAKTLVNDFAIMQLEHQQHQPGAPNQAQPFVRAEKDFPGYGLQLIIFCDGII